MKPVTVTTLREMKAAGDPITCLTAYDYSFASQMERAGLDMVMVGDSLGMTMQGHDSTLPVTLDEMAYHSRCVARGLERALLITDLPFGTYEAGPEQAFRSASRLMKEGSAHVVKLEGGVAVADSVRLLVGSGIPVCGHIGLTPQSVHQFGGFRVQGRGEAGQRLLEDARALEAAGASLVVLEAVPQNLARTITAELSIPTIGIGAGIHCDGQVLVLQDMIGLYPHRSPRFSKNFMEGQGSIPDALRAYVDAVKQRTFPADEHSFKD